MLNESFSSLNQNKLVLGFIAFIIFILQYSNRFDDEGDGRENFVHFSNVYYFAFRAVSGSEKEFVSVMKEQTHLPEHLSRFQFKDPFSELRLAMPSMRCVCGIR